MKSLAPKVGDEFPCPHNEGPVGPHDAAEHDLLFFTLIFYTAQGGNLKFTKIPIKNA